MRILFFNTILLLCSIPFFTNVGSNLHNNISIEINTQQKFSDTQIENFIKEVFKDHAEELVLKSDSGRLQLIKGFLNRFEIVQRADLRNKKINLLSTLSLNNKYNPALVRDDNYNAMTFNPLKYNFEITSNEIQLFRIDNTDYIIRILPIR